MIKLSEIIRDYRDIYLAKYSNSMLPSHKKALFDISSCRTPVMGGQVYKCNSCSHYHYSFHSCGNRSCNNCQNNNADDWLTKNNNLLLPVNYFMITFTLPDELRPFARSNQILFFNLLFNCSAKTLTPSHQIQNTLVLKPDISACCIPGPENYPFIHISII